MKEAIKKAIQNIDKLSPEEFHARMEDHKDGDIACFIRDMDEFSKSKEYADVIKKLA